MENSFSRKPQTETTFIMNEWERGSGFGFLQTFFLQMFCITLRQSAAGRLCSARVEQSPPRTCGNPFRCIADGPFASAEPNESLICCCHLQPTVTRSRINSRSSRAEQEQRRAAALSGGAEPRVCFTPHDKAQIQSVC